MKKIVILTFISLLTFAANAQNGAATIQDLGKALFNSMQKESQEEMSKYFVGEPELKVLKGAKDDKDEATMISFLAQATTMQTGAEWGSAKAQLEAAGVEWKKAVNPAVSHEPFQKNGREYSIVQVIFKCNDKMHTLTAVCVQINGLWYIAEDIEPNAHPAYDK